MQRYILGVFVLTATALAQQIAPQLAQRTVETQDKLYFEATAAVPAQGPMMAHFGGASAVVKGAPYSAEATTEMVQILIDGNRISNKSGNKSYRDAEGRTRVDITPSSGGGWMPNMKPFSLTMIDDPVSGDHVTLNNENKQATRFSYKGANTTTVTSAGTAGRAQSVTMVMRTSGDSVPPPPPPPVLTQAAGTRATASFVRPGPLAMAVGGYASPDMKADVKKESLGKQVIEGVECTGTRETATIPAGVVGNERAIETVTERWYSPELQLDVMTKTTDPRFGETSYRLGNIIRADQPKSLFEVPADFKVEEPNIKIMRDLKQQ